jgi:heat shock protein HslJ
MNREYDIRLRIMLMPLLVIAIIGVLASCGASGSHRESPTLAPEAGPKSPTADLNDTTWTLMLLRGVQVLEGMNITLSIREGKVEGFSGCNRFFSTGETVAKSGKFTVREIASTSKGCATDIVEQESAFQQALIEATGYRIDDDRLELLNSAGQPVLTFAK